MLPNTPDGKSANAEGAIFTQPSGKEPLKYFEGESGGTLKTNK